MFKNTKIKKTTRRTATTARKNKKRNNMTCKTFARRVWEIICIPFRALGRMLRRVWAWIKGLDLIATINITLLVAIIILFSMLIIDIINSNKKPVIIIANDIQPVEVAVNVVKPTPKKAMPKLPLARNPKTNSYAVQPVNVVPVKKDTVAVRQMPRVQTKLYGDIIIDSRGAAAVLKNGDTINGNLYLQNMRKYTLPCDVKVNGNLFLRDVNMLQFSGRFTVTGNIYVSPRSSFGPLPRDARIGGHVIL